MTVETFSRVCGLLSKMPSAIPWSEGQSELYAVGLQGLPDYVVSDAVNRAIVTCDERPSVAALIRLATEVMNGPRLSAASAWEEVEALMISRGLYCQPDPFKPNIWREGEPSFSHPLIGKTIKQMGGWKAVCTSEQGMEYLQDRFRILLEEIVDRTSREAPNLLVLEAVEEAPAGRRLRVAAGGR